MAPEYKFTTFHPGNGEADQQAQAITDQLNRWSGMGWRVQQVIRPGVVGAVSFLLVRDGEPAED
ncbi:hypothetical protein [Homoserinibacter sp. YIM 151385]|uniref:hypothetical protein n=1 Tax=Homoserinibacter sp. YIM 151385 TaxID=2985506 RepID=UPI0022EFE827|nr:hypothetical protein [Homoserinibacter sp. YIM 151385]WBU37434.1 hypothetical protein OF852_10985 [Homoserinibacter sp. YIM 151385]